MTQEIDNSLMEEEGYGTTVGLQETKWNWKGSGYNSVSGKLFLDGKVVPELRVVVFEAAQWKQVTNGLTKQKKRILGSYHIKERRDNMVQGEKVEKRFQIVFLTPHDGEMYVFGSTNQNTIFGNWFKTGKGDERYYPKGLPVGIWTELQEYVNRVATQRRLKGFDPVPQYGFEFTIAPASESIETGGDFSQTVYPLVVTSDFEFVGWDRLKQYEQLYIQEDLENWTKKRSNPTGVVISDENGTHEYEDAGEPMMYDEDEVLNEPETDDIPF